MNKLQSGVLGILALFVFNSCTVSVTADNDTESTMPSPLLPQHEYNVALLMVDGVYNSELMAPMDIFHHSVFHSTPAMKVFTVSPSLDPITTFEGLNIIPDYSYLSDSLPEIDVLVVPSAEHSMDSDLQNEELIAFVKLAGEKAKYVMSLCDGAFVLAQAGLVDGRESTTFPSDISAYRKMFPALKVHENVSFVHDGKLITSAGGAKSYDPSLYLCELLYGKKAADGIAGGMVIDWEVSKLDYIRVKR